MQKLHCKICDGCRTVLDSYTTIKGKKRELHYCDKCLQKEWKKWLELRTSSIDEHKEKLCYCGHTHKCSCLDPGFELFKESIERGTIILNNPNNGWKKHV